MTVKQKVVATYGPGHLDGPGAIVARQGIDEKLPILFTSGSKFGEYEISLMKYPVHVPMWMNYYTSIRNFACSNFI
jgi:hypothetical protein